MENAGRVLAEAMERKGKGKGKGKESLATSLRVCLKRMRRLQLRETGDGFVVRYDDGYYYYYQEEEDDAGLRA
jgi:hypothetical protein